MSNSYQSEIPKARINIQLRVSRLSALEVWQDNQAMSDATADRRLQV